MESTSVRPGYELWRPNREKAQSKTTKALVAFVLLVSAGLLVVITIGGWTRLEGTSVAVMSLLWAGLYVVFAFLVARWQPRHPPGRLGPRDHPRDLRRRRRPGLVRALQGRAHPPPLPDDLLGLLTILVVPVQLLLITVAMVGFNQEWHVEEERPVGGVPLAGEDTDEAPPPPPGTSHRPPPGADEQLEELRLRLARLEQVGAVLADVVDRVADLARTSRSSGAGASNDASSSAPAPGSSHRASASGASTTGMRSWIGRISSFGSQVTIAQLCRSPAPSRAGSAAQMPAKANSSPSAMADPDRRLPGLAIPPLVEAVGGDQAAALAERLGEGGLALERLGAGVDQRRARAALGPAPGDEAPAKAAQLALAALIAPDRQHRIGGGDVVARLLLELRRTRRARSEPGSAPGRGR